MSDIVLYDVCSESWGTWGSSAPPVDLPDGICEKHWQDPLPKPACIVGRQEKCACDPRFLAVRFEGVGRLFFEAVPELHHKGMAAKRALLAAQAPTMYRLLEKTLQGDLAPELREQIEQTMKRARGER